jgi:hypothetical protein
MVKNKKKKKNYFNIFLNSKKIKYTIISNTIRIAAWVFWIDYHLPLMGPFVERRKKWSGGCQCCLSHITMVAIGKNIC